MVYGLHIIQLKHLQISLKVLFLFYEKKQTNKKNCHETLLMRLECHHLSVSQSPFLVLE